MASRRTSGPRGSSGLRHELLDLANHLRQERLFVQSEKLQLQDLNERVKNTAEVLSHTAWLAHRQREILENLIFAPRGSANECLPTIVCLRANLLEQTAFQDAYKHLNHQEILYAEFLLNLRSKPKLLAHCLMLSDRSGNDKMPGIISTVFSGIYGSCMLAEDERLQLRLLHHLMRLQLSTSANPRKLLRQGNCAFSRLYKSFSEELFSAKLFLTAALHDPILKLLSDDEVFLDVDPAKVIIRFSTPERERRFGKENSPDYSKKVKQQRDFVCSKLEALTNNFIRGIKENLHCFPPSLARLLKAMYNMLMANKVEPRLVNAVCVDVLFSLFICPAIVDPNPVGIIDTPISNVARSNLMQIAQILQVLALWKWEEIDPRLMDLYSRFDKDTLGTVLEAMLDLGSDAYLLVGMSNNSSTPLPPEDDMDLELTYFDDALASFESGGDLSHHSTRLSRLAVLLTMEELTELIQMLRSVQGHADLSEVDASELATLLDPLPSEPHKSLKKPTKDSKNVHSTPNNVKEGVESSALAAMIAKRQVLSNKLSTAVNNAVRRSSSLTASTPSTPGSDETPSSVGDLGISPVPNSVNESGAAVNGGDAFDESTLLLQCEPDTVLVVPFPDRHTGELPGFLPEEHVISRSRQAARVVRMNLANLPGGDDAEEDHEEGQAAIRRNSHGNATVNSEENSSLMSVGPTGEKRTRFSLSHDEGSIGNTSDNLEAISEAASNHSVASSLEDEPDNPDTEDPINDNLSDMVSANVSGRGTPNVSGRDTPSSQVTEDGADDSHNRPARPEDNNVGQNHQQVANDNRPADGQVGGVAGAALGNRIQRGRKSGEPDLDEKFGKFEIKPPSRNLSSVPHQPHSAHMILEQGDETISMVSDTWSTDVLASDTETTMGDGDDRHSRRNRVRLPDDLAAGVDRQLSATSSSQGGISGSVGVGGGASSIASSSAANLLDVAETASEAWSIDVLASDTESLRLAELDNEDTGSVARSDDTTRSDPAELLLAMEGTSGGSKSRLFSSDAGAMRQSRADVVEQWARQSSGHAQRLSSSSAIQRRGSDSLAAGNVRPAAVEGSILKKPQSIPETSDTAEASAAATSSAPRLLSHPSAASIASSTESSTGESAGGKDTSKPSNTVCQGEVEVAMGSGGATSNGNPVASSSSGATPTKDAMPKKSTLSMSSTGAIPKSISFDKTVMMSSRHAKDESPVSSSSEVDPRFSTGESHHENGPRSLSLKQRGDKSFFKSWKLPKIGRQRGGSHMGSYKTQSTDALLSSSNIDEMLPTEGILVPTRLSHPEEVSADDILAKYRSKPRTTTDGELSTSNEVILSAPFGASNSGGTDLVDAGAGGCRSSNGGNAVRELDDLDERLVMDPHNVEASYAFQDAKRKLRMMLSEADLSLLTTSLPSSSSSTVVRDLKATNDLVALLKVQLAEAHNLQDRNMVAQLHETLRCLSLFDNEACRKLVRSLKEDYKRRSPYLAYLVKCRQGLLATLAHQRRLLSRMEADRRVCSAHQLNVCIRLFLEKREKQMGNFVTTFRESCPAADEKIALMERFLASLWSQLEADTSVTLLTANSPTQMDTCRVAVERAVVAQIYYHAMYPNGEADVSRDVVLNEHMSKLASEISPSHRDLRIARQYHYEAPWPSAQAVLGQLAAFKTPKDKVACVVRCCQTIMNLLSLSAKSNVPAADDFMPVLVYVVVKANPPSLLSTVQYVESFYGNRLSGEDHYWWMQFVAAIEFIKTMDYSSC